jgi:methionyl-tRNA formyltransferase
MPQSDRGAKTMKMVEQNGSYRAVREHHDDRLRIVLLSSDDPHHLYLRAALMARFRLVGAVVESSRRQQARLWERRKYIDWLYRYYHLKRQKLTGRSAYRARYFDALLSKQKRLPVACTSVDHINSAQAVEKVRELKPDVTIVCGTMFIARRMIDASGLCINIHGGYLPDYKGNHGVFFAYYHRNYEKIGATLHRVTLQLDGGDILEVVKPDIFPHDNDEHLYCRSVHMAINRLLELLQGFESRGQVLVFRKQDGIGRTYRHRSRKPHCDLSLWLRRRLGRLRVPHIPNTPAS